MEWSSRTRGEHEGGAGRMRARPAVPAPAARWGTRLCTSPRPLQASSPPWAPRPGKGRLEQAESREEAGSLGHPPSPDGTQQETYGRPEALTSCGHFLEQKTPLTVHFQTVRITVGDLPPPQPNGLSTSSWSRKLQ